MSLIKIIITLVGILLLPTIACTITTQENQENTNTQILSAPTQISPCGGTVFGQYPRTTTLVWTSVPGAVSYKIWIECCWENDCYLESPCGKVVTSFTTSYTFDFVGAQPGRWRVCAVDAQGYDGTPSDWCYFSYTR